MQHASVHKHDYYTHRYRYTSAVDDIKTRVPKMLLTWPPLTGCNKVVQMESSV